MNKKQAKDRMFWIGFTGIIVSLTMSALTIKFPNISDAVFYSVILPMFVLFIYAYWLIWRFRIYRGDKLVIKDKR